MKRQSMFPLKDLRSMLARKTLELRAGEDRGLLLNAVYIWIANLLPGALGAVFWWYCSRIYSPAQVGLASAIISTAIFISTLSRLGLDISIIRFLPTSENKPHLLNIFLSFTLVTAILTTGIFYILIPIASPKLESLIQSPGNMLVFLVFCIASTQVGSFRAVYVAGQAAKYTFLTTLISNVIKLVLLIVGSLVIASLGDVQLMVGTVLIGVLLATTAGIKIFLPSVIANYRFKFSFNWINIRPILPYSIGNMLVDFVIQAPQTIIPLMILNILGEVSNGHAYVALMIGSMLAGPGLALGRSAFAAGANKLEEAQKILIKAGKTGGLFTIPIAGLTILAAPWMLSFFGESYSFEAASLLQWMAAASPLVVVVQLYYTKLRIDKNVKWLVGLSLINVLTSLVVTAIGLPIFGVSAAGLGTVAGNLLVMIIIGMILVRSKVK